MTSRAKYRKTVIQQVAALVNKSRSRYDFIRRLQRLYPNCYSLGEGIDRIVFPLPGGMVCKVDEDDNQNVQEYRMSRRLEYRKHMPVIHVYLKNKTFDVLISQRVRILHHIMPRYTRQFDNLCRLFFDVRGGNVGYLKLDPKGRRRKLLMADAGLGRRLKNGRRAGTS